ncbi:MAG: sugar phosphate isomerase/epimerase [Arenicella sp.]|jgi:sugar phosphate isomerase/epimerase
MKSKMGIASATLILLLMLTFTSNAEQPASGLGAPHSETKGETKGERKGEAKSEVKIAVQLWSVKEDLAKDFEGTIKALANMGFQGVELAGEFGEFSTNPKALADFIRSTGMQISGAHIDFDSLSDKRFEATIDFYKTAGVALLLIGYDARAGDSATIEQTIDDLNRLTKKVEANGIRFGYHNHDFEFRAYKNATFWDHIANATADTMVLQMDVGWVNFAGAEPIDYVRKYPGRTLSTHYKGTLHPTVKNRLPIIGQDSIDWAALYKINRDIGGTTWIVIEQEEYPLGLSPLEAVRLSKYGLDKALAPFKEPLIKSK